MIKTPFVNRKTELDENRDYISEANDYISKNGSIDITNPLYQNAISQFNEDLGKRTVTRLEVPEGFCGYIDPNSGEFRVEPEGIITGGSSTLFPDNIVDPEDVPEVEITPYPIDQCLSIGLPGSYEYTQGNCGVEDGDNSCSGIAWYSGGGTGSEAGTSGLNQRVCGGGPGINSNTGLAASDPVAGVTEGFPDEVWKAATELALSLYPDTSVGAVGVEDTGAGYVTYSVSNLIGTIINYDFFYNVNDPPGTVGAEAFKQAGLRIRVTWDLESKEVLEVTDTKMWEYKLKTGFED